jgi:hypothetical protein
MPQFILGNVLREKKWGKVLMCARIRERTKECPNQSVSSLIVTMVDIRDPASTGLIKTTRNGIDPGASAKWFPSKLLQMTRNLNETNKAGE